MTVKRLDELHQDGVPFDIGEDDFEVVEESAPNTEKGNGKDRTAVPLPVMINPIFENRSRMRK